MNTPADSLYDSDEQSNEYAPLAAPEGGGTALLLQHAASASTSWSSSTSTSCRGETLWGPPLLRSGGTRRSPDRADLRYRVREHRGRWGDLRSSPPTDLGRFPASPTPLARLSGPSYPAADEPDGWLRSTGRLVHLDLPASGTVNSSLDTFGQLADAPHRQGVPRKDRPTAGQGRPRMNRWPLDTGGKALLHGRVGELSPAQLLRGLGSRWCQSLDTT